MELSSYFLKSERHKKLLELLFFHDDAFSAFELSKLTGLPYATVYSEMNHLKNSGAISEKIVGKTKLYRNRLPANIKSALEVLLGISIPRDRDTELSPLEVRAALQEAGAPIVLEGDSATTSLSLEEALARGSLLAKQDPSLARAIPVVLFKNKFNLETNRLLVFARRLQVKQELGFFLELTSELSKEQMFKRAAKPFRDKRLHLISDFFVDQSSSPMQRFLAERNTPELARKWKFRMNMSLATFQSTFERFKT